MAQQVWINGEWQTILVSHNSLQDIGTLAHAEIETRLVELDQHRQETGNPHGLTAADLGLDIISGTNYPFQDSSNGLFYKVIARDNAIGLEEVADATGSIPTIVKDTTGSIYYQVIATNGVMALEEVPGPYPTFLPTIVGDYRNGRFYTIIATNGVICLEEMQPPANRTLLWDAPADGKQYVRINGTWQELVI
jgi:hypothetical protein